MSDENVDQAGEPNATRDSMSEAAEELAASIRDGVSAVRKAATESAPATVTPTPVPSEPLTAERLNKIAEEEGVGGALHAVGREVLVPLQGQSFNLAKEARRENVEQHPQLGEFARKNKAKIDELIVQRGITDQELATKGFTGIVQELYNGDPAVQQEKFDKEVQARVDAALIKAGITPSQEGAPAAAPVTPSTGAPARPPVERPSATPVAAPIKQGQTREDAINAVKVTPEELSDARQLWHMSEYDLKKQKFEIEEQRQLLGDRGLKAVGGIPVCTLEECGLPIRSE